VLGLAIVMAGFTAGPALACETGSASAQQNTGDEHQQRATTTEHDQETAGPSTQHTDHDTEASKQPLKSESSASADTEDTDQEQAETDTGETESGETESGETEAAPKATTSSQSGETESGETEAAENPTTAAATQTGVRTGTGATFASPSAPATVLGEQLSRPVAAAPAAAAPNALAKGAVGAQVLGAQLTRSPSALPFTGFAAWELAGLAGLLLVVGAATVLALRRRSA
jgi:hypothetical protein